MAAIAWHHSQVTRLRNILAAAVPVGFSPDIAVCVRPVRTLTQRQGGVCSYVSYEADQCLATGESCPLLWHRKGAQSKLGALPPLCSPKDRLLLSPPQRFCDPLSSPMFFVSLAPASVVSPFPHALCPAVPGSLWGAAATHRGRARVWSFRVCTAQHAAKVSCALGKHSWETPSHWARPAQGYMQPAKGMSLAPRANLCLVSEAGRAANNGGVRAAQKRTS